MGVRAVILHRNETVCGTHEAGCRLEPAVECWALPGANVGHMRSIVRVCKSDGCLRHLWGSVYLTDLSNTVAADNFCKCVRLFSVCGGTSGLSSQTFAASQMKADHHNPSQIQIRVCDTRR
jgi:hypothetical protein